MYYSRCTKREIKEKLKRLGVVKPHFAEFLIKDIYGDIYRRGAVVKRVEHISTIVLVII